MPARCALALALLTSVAVISHSLGDLVSEDNDLLFYLGCLVVIALYLGKIPALLAAGCALLLLSAGKVHSGFAVHAGHFQYLLSFAFVVFCVHQIASLSDRVRRDAWASKQEAQILGMLGEFEEQISEGEPVGPMLRNFFRGRLALPVEVDEQLHVRGEISAFWQGVADRFSERARHAQAVLERAAAYRSHALLAATQKLQSALINSFSHDFQTPLSSISGVLEVLASESGELSDEQRRRLANIGFSQTDRLLHLARNLLSLGKLEGGSLRLSDSWVDLVGVLGSTVDRLEEAERVRVATGDSVPVVRGDGTLLAQVIFNLLDNALKFSQDEVVCDFEVTASEVVLRVLDQGCGVAQGEEQRIFERFFRGTTPDQVPGSGLGLHICQAVAELHHGALAVERREGGGSAFSLRVPRDYREGA